ncbi:hypothetical protein ACFV80_36830 [Streptomyces sp. NPDC059862]|uniref:hypothetical protein n=1 Tax=Streptomyces sp. NPDC059862 TaxID=3346975 RepID=UPI00365AA02D
MLPGQFWTLLDRGRSTVGKPGVFKKPPLDDGPLKDLNDALHALHLRAGRPSLTEMYAALSEEAKKSISRSTLHSALANTALPRRDTVDALVEILGTRARNTTPEEELPRLDALWQLAAGEIASDALAEVPLLDLSSLIEWHLDRHPEDARQVFRLLDEFLSEGASGWRDRLLDLYRVLLRKGMAREWNLPDSFPRDVYPGVKGIAKGDDGKPTGFALEIDEF